MPELPEVETIRRSLEPLVVGRTIAEVEAHTSQKFSEALDAAGADIAAMDRRGKYLLFRLDDDRDLVVHLGMTGQLLLDPGPADAYQRAAWHFGDGGVLRFRDVRRFGRLRVVPRDDYSTIATLHHLGPEPFDDDFTPESLHTAIAASSRRLKTQLLSQRPVAGVGNIYADEALWLAQVHPAARTLSRPRSERLHAAIVDVLAAALHHGGTTLRDYRQSDGSTGENQHHLACYGRSGEPCERCGDELRSRVYDARTTTWCPTCQRR